jgi:outer membrane protein assembly factor BamA
MNNNSSLTLRYIFLISTVCFLSSFLSGQESDTRLTVNSIQISGNRVTKENTILRELEFAAGDTILGEVFQEKILNSEENLMNISLFNFVSITYTADVSEDASIIAIPVNVYIDITERWYTWPVPFAYFEERNFNDWLERKDLSRVSYGLMVVRENFRGRREQFTLGFKTGFNDLVSIKYSNPGIDQSRSIGIGFSASYARDHNIFWKTMDHQQQLLNLENEFAIENKYLHLSMTKRFGIRKSFRVYGQYNHYTFSDTLFSLNPNFTDPARADMKFFTISLLFKFDYRDYIHYPLEGFFADCEITKKGLGILTDENFSIVTIHTSLRKYWKLDEKLFFASGITTRLRLDGNNSYYFGKGLGFGNEYVRGYESYVIDGEHYFIVKGNLKYNFIPQKILKIGCIKTEKFNTIPYRFYANFFTDCGYIRNFYTADFNSLSNRLLFGYGLGIDFVTYYDRAYRFEISRNSENQFSFAIQFTAPI